MRMIIAASALFLTLNVHAQAETFVLEGIGRTDVDAAEDARRRARDVFLDYLHTRTPPILAWSPSPADVDKLLGDNAGVPGDPHETPDGTFARTWIVRLTLPGEPMLRQWDNQVRRGRIAFFVALSALVAVGLFTGACWYAERKSLQRDAV
jgi:hypothetical protein